LKSKPTAPGEKPIEHKFGLQYLPQQEIAKLNYSGYLDSTFTYAAVEENLSVDALKKLNDRERVGVNYSTALQSTNSFSEPKEMPSRTSSRVMVVPPSVEY
jgi:hypothetical protein